MNHAKYMEKALLEAQKAYDLDEVPVGAIIVDESGTIIAKSHNSKEGPKDPCGHAEIIAINEAAKALSSWRLTNCSLYVTLEPCMMCAGAIVQSRLSNVHFGASDPKAGFIKSIAHGFDFPHNHKPSWSNGTLELECSNLLKKFFKQKRSK